MNEGIGEPCALSFCGKETDGLAKINSPWRAVGMAGLIGADLAIFVLAGVWLGRYIDRQLATSPWFMLGGLLVGLAVGVYSVYRIVRRYF